MPGTRGQRQSCSSEKSRAPSGARFAHLCSPILSFWERSAGSKEQGERFAARGWRDFRRQEVEVLPLAELPKHVSPPPRRPRAVRSHKRWSWGDRLARTACWGPAQLRITEAFVPAFLALSSHRRNWPTKRRWKSRWYLPVSADEEGQVLLSVFNKLFHLLTVRLLTARCASRGQ
jgi:hypothetical protein